MAAKLFNVVLYQQIVMFKPKCRYLENYFNHENGQKSEFSNNTVANISSGQASFTLTNMDNGFYQAYLIDSLF